MKNVTSLLLSMALMLDTASVTFAQDETKGDQKEPNQRTSQKKEANMSTEENVQVMLEIFRAIERRDPQRPDPRALDLFQPDVEFHWPPSLPYGGTARGLKPQGPTWSETWDPLQPTAAERKMDARVVAASQDEVVILWRQRGVSPAGDRIDSEVLGLYQLREGKLARAQMFYFDTAGVLSFLAKAKAQAKAPKP
jgi:ketosteroid isomerase-like protein